MLIRHQKTTFRYLTQACLDRSCCSSIKSVNPLSTGMKNDPLLPFSSSLLQVHTDLLREPRGVNMKSQGLTGSSVIGLDYERY